MLFLHTLSSICSHYVPHKVYYMPVFPWIPSSDALNGASLQTTQVNNPPSLCNITICTHIFNYVLGALKRQQQQQKQQQQQICWPEDVFRLRYW